VGVGGLCPAARDANSAAGRLVIIGRMTPGIRSLWMWVALSTPAAAVSAQPVSPSGELAEMRAEIARLRVEIDTLKSIVASLVPTSSPTPAEAAPQPGELPPPLSAPDEAPDADLATLESRVSLLAAQVAEQAQTKVGSASRLPVRLFGMVHSSTSVNSGEANWLENPNLVAAAPAGLDTGSFSSTLRQSRLGVAIDGPAVGRFQASGVLLVDFFGGIPAFQTGPVMGLPRLLYGFARLDDGRTAIEVGQDEMILAPRNPTSLAATAFPSLFRSGNLYLRVPQARVEHVVVTGAASRLRVTSGLVAPVAGDFANPAYTFVPPALAGERSRWPGLQAHVGWSHGNANASGVSVGVSGHYGRERQAQRTDRNWAAAVDFDVRVGRIGAAGEFFAGDRVDMFGGALGQQGRSAGGFLEGRVQATERLAFVGGGGTDRVRDARGRGLALDRNTSLFGNATYRLTPELAAAFEYRWLSTRPAFGADRRNHHLNWVLAYEF